MKYGKQIKAALIAIAAIVSFIGLVNFLKGNDFFQKGRRFYAIYEDVSGLEPSRPVLVNGLKVGKVESIAFHSDKSGKLVVGFRIWSDFEFSKKSTVVITESGLVDGPQLNLLMSNEGKIAIDQDTLSSAVKPSQIAALTNSIDPIKIKLQKTLDNMDRMLLSLNVILNEENASGIKKMIKGLNSALASVKSGADAAVLMVGSNQSTLNHSLEGIGDAAETYKKLAMRIEKIPIQETFQHLESSLESLSQLIDGINKGHGTLGKLAGNDQLYNQLNGLSKELELLTRDFRLHPKRYVHFSVFGKKEVLYSEKNESINPTTDKKYAD
ncbi:MlaD family protein [Bacteroidetes bacterium endosymbiont of Geopemphigus sp.]|uniref:MlaD family protein n=1 Tax=Bacteroidetes bacterium endosymbiont of Geopemphigus sp. TaxID=2047937 RepID=UPI0018A82A24|nr:MlaD family protein [Bacteroidetes bacterium endosymbiont of Geopemphigus sp.]